MDNLAQSQVLEEELSNRGLSRSSLLYQDKTCLIYSGTHVSDSGRKNVSVNVKAYLANSECAVVKREFEILKTIEHPNLIRIQSYFFFEYLRGQFVLVCITELPAKTIHHDITLRSTNQLPWEDSKLFEVAKQLIEAFSLLQLEGIAHRDIKPQNLFLDTELRPKIGGFGSSRSIVAFEAADYSTHGSAFYMSPELKQLQSDGHAGRTVFSRIKADVYSLGMTLLYMYTRTPPTSLLNLSTLETETDTALQGVLDQGLKQLLTLMLAIHPNTRPDFQQLTQFFTEDVIIPPKVSGSLGLIGCRHVARGAEFCFPFPCHGQYCRECSPAVSFMVYLNDRSWYQLKCPICLESYEMCWDEQQMVEIKTQEESESGFKLSTDHPSELLSSLGEGKIPIFNRCLWCKQRLEASISRNPLKSILILNCVHRFCSQTCFCNFYRFASNGYQDFDVRCSACPLFIPKELAEEFFGGHFIFKRVIAASALNNGLCRICRTNIGTFCLHETHWYCADCHRFMAQPKQAHCVSCLDCTAEIKMSQSMRTEEQTGCCCFGYCSDSEEEKVKPKPKRKRKDKKVRHDEEATIMQEK